MINIAIFASGSGTNAQAICEYFLNSEKAKVVIILSNNPDAYVLTRAKNANIPSVVFNKDEFYRSEKIRDLLQQYNVDFVVLAGFLWLVPQNLTKAYVKRMVNIHPALLPKHGGKGMYGMKVHEAVVANCDKESGITIHFVNEVYDSGDIIMQAKCEILPTDTAEDVAQKVHSLEYLHFPKVIEDTIMKCGF